MVAGGDEEVEGVDCSLWGVDFKVVEGVPPSKYEVVEVFLEAHVGLCAKSGVVWWLARVRFEDSSEFDGVCWYFGFEEFQCDVFYVDFSSQCRRGWVNEKCRGNNGFKKCWRSSIFMHR